MSVLWRLHELTGHEFITLTDRGNSAITAALELLPAGKKLLIPAEGGWIHYKKGPEKAGILYEEVACNQAAILLDDLKVKLAPGEFGGLLYQNPGGYFARQPMQEIYAFCQQAGCLVFLDVSGSLGTPLCDGRYADLCLGSFGEDKLVNLGVGGFLSCNSEDLFRRLVLPLFPEEELEKLAEKLHQLPQRIAYLQEKRKKILKDLKEYGISHQVVHPQEEGFVIVVKYTSLEEKEKLMSYCQKNALPFTECPRYIRLNEPAISIEIKRL